MTDRLADSLADSLSHWLTDWLTTSLAHRQTQWLTCWLTDWCTDLLTDWLTDWLTDILTDLLTDLLTNFQANWLADWSTRNYHLTVLLIISWLTDSRRLIDRLAGSLTHWLIDLADVLRFIPRNDVIMMWIRITDCYWSWSFFISDQMCPADVSRL